MKWFVYVEIDYYPYAEVVEADSREEAITKVNERDRDVAYYAVPFDPSAAVGVEWRRKGWEDEA